MLTSNKQQISRSYKNKNKLDYQVEINNKDEINEMQTKITIQGINETKILFFETINKSTNS